MARPRRRLRVSLAVPLVACLAGAAGAASHREAPLISQDPFADNTDVYTFVTPSDPNRLTLIANWIPLEEPAAGPNFYSFSDSVLYEIKIDTDRDGKADRVFRFDFSTELRGTTPFAFTGGFGGVPLITALEGPGSEGLGVIQRYTLVDLRRVGKKLKGSQIASGIVAPPNVGKASMPNYDALAAEAVVPLPNGGRAFAGPRDDPFYIDLGAAFDLLSLRRTPPVLTAEEDAGATTNPFGVDALAGRNVHTIAIELPKIELTTDPNAVLGVWATASRPQRTVIKGAPKLKARDDRDDLLKTGGSFVQVSRLGNPLVNEVIISLRDKDLYNASDPLTDAIRIGSFLSPQIVPVLGDAVGTPFPATGRTDLVTTFLKYPGQDPGECSPASPCADLLRIDIGVSPTAPGSENRLGVLGGDPAGFPNGRRLGDDVVDIALRVLAGAGAPRIGDGVNRNDVDFDLSTFPYLASPHPGNCPALATAGRAVILDNETGSLPAGTRLCLDKVSGGCVGTGPECTAGETQLPHLHLAISIAGEAGTFPDPASTACGHGVVVANEPGCGPDTVPACGGG
jgi:hypothetical protein